VARLNFRAGVYSLRARLFIALFITGIAPQALVFAFSFLERPVVGRMHRATEAAMNEARDAAQRPNAREELREVAQKYRVRVRLYDHDNHQ